MKMPRRDGTSGACPTAYRPSLRLSRAADIPASRSIRASNPDDDTDGTGVADAVPPPVTTTLSRPTGFPPGGIETPDARWASTANGRVSSGHRATVKHR